MAKSPCVYTYKGKEYSYSELAAHLHNGELNKLAADGILKGDFLNSMPSEFKKNAAVENNNESIEPIRELGNGSKVFFESEKYRVNELTNGKYVLNIGNENDVTPIANVEFENLNEAVKVAKKLDEIRPNGLTDFYNIDKVIENLKEEVRNESAQQENAGVANENIQPGVDAMESIGVAEQQNNSEQNNEATNDSGNDGTTPSSKNKIVQIQDGNLEYDVELDESGDTVSITNKKTGKKLERFVVRENKSKKGNTTITKANNAKFSRIAAMAENRLTRDAQSKLEKKEYQDRFERARQNFVVTTEYEAAIEAVANGAKMSMESVAKETGNKDNSWATDQFLKQKQPSVEVLSEQIHSNYPDLDQTEIRNALIDVISSFGNIQQVRDAFIEMAGENIEKQKREELNAFMSNLSEKDRTLVESIMEEDAFFEGMDYDEKVKFYEKQYGTEQERLQAEQQDQLERPEQPNGESDGGNSSAQERSGEGKSENQENEVVGSFTEDSVADDMIKYLDNLYNDLDKFGKENLSMGIPIVVAKAVIQAMKLAVQAGKSFAQAIQAGIDELRNSSWYQSLTSDEQSQAENDIVDLLANGDRNAKNQIYRLVQQNITKEEAYEKVNKAFENQKEQLENKKAFREWAKKTYSKFMKRFSDRQYDIKRLLLKTGLTQTENLLVNAHGASGLANKIFEEAYDKIYRGLNGSQRETLNKVIQLRRFIAIDQNRSQRGLEPVTHPNFIDENVSQKFLDKLKEEIGEEAFNDLNKRADEYFKAYSKMLDEMFDEGFISQEAYDSMNGLDYQPRVFLQFITDFNGDLSEGKKQNNNNSSGLSQEAVKSMKEGDASAMVTDSQWLLMNSLAARQKAIANNRVNKKFITEEFQKAKQKFEAIDPKNFKDAEEERFYKYFKELSEKVIENPVVGVTDSGNLKFKYDKTPNNFAKMYYWEDGQRKEFFLEQELHDAWNDNVAGLFTPGVKEGLSYASGSALVKAIATGNNPAFPIVNTPRDFLFTLTFSNEYSGFVPKAMAQISKDVLKALSEIKKGANSEIMKKYFEYGGAMDFLSSQGVLKKESVVGKAIEKAIDPKAKDTLKKIFKAATLHKISQYSELMFRLGLFQRSISNQVKELGFNDISEITDKNTVDDIYSQAVANARGILDFNQGGAITKDLEAVIPYINVAVQGGRVALKSINENPIKTTSKITQVAMIASSVPIGLSLLLIGSNKDDDDERSAAEIYLDAYQGVSRYKKSKYMIIFDGTKNEDGEYRYWQIAKAQELSPVISYTDNVMVNALRSASGKPKKSQKDILKEVLSTFNDHVMPVDFTSPQGFFTRAPIIKATLTYQTGYDFFREEPLSMKLENKPAPWEGLEMKNVEDFYKKAGEKFGVSPVRSKAFVESLVTTPDTNPFVGLVYGGADVLAADKDAKDVGKKLLETAGKSVVKRIVGHTSEFNRQLEASKELEKKLDEIKMKDALNKMEFKKIANQYINKEITDKELNEKIKEYDPIDQKRFINKVKDRIKLKDVDGAILDIKYEQSPEAKAVMILHYYGDVLDGNHNEILVQMRRAGGILTPPVIYELDKKKKELMKKEKPE